MDNVRPEGNEDQYITSTGGEDLERNVHMRPSECTRKFPHQYEPWFGADRQWKSDDVESIVYMIKSEDFNRNVDTDDILSIMADWYSEDCMDVP